MELRNITRIYHNKYSDVVALCDLNLKVLHKGITAIIGPSGCGKTTLLNIMSGQDKQFDGEYIVKGNVEVIEQEIVLFEAMRVIDNLEIISDDKDKIQKLLKLFHMSEHQNKKVKKLSLGQKKRVQVMRSLLKHPDYLICDEPTAALDVNNAKIVMNALKQVSEKISVIIVTHDLAIVELYADDVVKMKKGGIQEILYRKNEEEYHPKIKKIPKKTMMNHMMLFHKIVKSRIWEQLFLFVIVFILCILLFVVGIFNNLNQSVSIKEKWRTGENIITSFPNSENDVLKDKDKNSIVLPESDSIFFYYDLYSNEDIQLVKDNLSEIIGYRCGWNVEIFSQLGTWLPCMNAIETYKKLQKREEEAKIKGIPLTQNELYLQSYFKNMSIEELKNSKESFINFENLERINNRTEVYYENANVSINQVLSNLGIYQIFDHYEMALQYGDWMKSDDEIVIPYNVAQQMVELNFASSIEALIGEEIYIYMHKYDNFDNTQQEAHAFRISGISYYGSEDTNYIFMREGVWDKIRSNFYGFKDDVRYQYVDFIVEDGKDSDKITQKVDELLESKESYFASRAGSEMVKKAYQNEDIIYFFITFMFMTIVSMLILSQIITNKRRYKENKIMCVYQYNPYVIVFLKVIVIFIITGMIQLLALPYICNTLNAFVSSLGFEAILNDDVYLYLLSWVFGLVVVLVIEIAFQKRKSEGM